MPSVNAQPEAVTVRASDTGLRPIDPMLEKIAAYIAAHRSRTLFDPVALSPFMLPHLFILTIEPDAQGAPPRLWIRLTGTALDAAFGRCVRGHYLEEFLHGAHSAAVLGGFCTCALKQEDIWMRQVVQIANKAPRFVEGVACYVEPDAIYGGMLFGELPRGNEPSSFESRKL